MILLTYGQAKAEIARVSGVSGMSVNDPRVIDRANIAVYELMSEGDFPNVVDQWHIRSLDGHIVLPTFLDRLMQINVGGVPTTIASPWYQFVAYGPGTREDSPACDFGRFWCDESMITDLGEHPTQVLLPESGGPWNLRVITNVDETIVVDGTSEPPVCTIQGLDGSGNIIRTQVDGAWINGEQVALDFTQPYVETVNQFSAITAFTKPATNGPIELDLWDGTSQSLLSNYVFSDTNPSYHHYFSRWLQNLNVASDSPWRVVRARCRKRYVPVVEDTDELIISNLPALKEMVIAVWKREADNLESYAAHKQTAVDLMKKEANAYRGKSRIPALSFQRGCAMGSDMPFVR